jgi:hypothetical protein
MFNEMRIKLHKLLMGNPKATGFVNPYAKVEVPKKKREFVNPYAKPTSVPIPVATVTKRRSFQFIVECAHVVKGDGVSVKNRFVGKATSIPMKLHEQKVKKQEYEAFVELAMRGNK